MDEKDLSSLLESAFELKIATLKAEEKEIYRYSRWADNFQVNTDLFREMFKDRKYEIGLHDEYYKYKYVGAINGLTFITVTDNLLFDSDTYIELDEGTGNDEL